MVTDWIFRDGFHDVAGSASAVHVLPIYFEILKVRLIELGKGFSSLLLFEMGHSSLNPVRNFLTRAK